MIKIEYSPYSRSRFKRTDVFDQNGKLSKWKHEEKTWNNPRSPVQLQGYSSTGDRHEYESIDWNDTIILEKLILGEYQIVTSMGKCPFIEERSILSIDSHFEE